MTPRGASTLCIVNDTGESIFEYEYLREYKATIENIWYI